MIRIQTLHNDIPKPIKHLIEDSRPVKGGHIIPDCNASIFLVAKRNSGKTTTLFKILRSCINKTSTTVIIFCANLYTDKSYAVIRKWLKDNNINWIGYTSIIENNVNHLQVFSAMIKEMAEDENNDDNDDNYDTKHYNTCHINAYDPEEPLQKKKDKNSKYQTPKYIIIFDDMSDQLKGPHLESLLKNGRHFARVIISTQYLHDIKPEARKQIGYWLIFKSNKDKLPIIYKDADLSIDYNLFEELYDKAVSEQYSFLYVDVRNEEYRINFNKKFILP